MPDHLTAVSRLEQLLFRTRAEKAQAEADLNEYRDFVRDIAAGAIKDPAAAAWKLVLAIEGRELVRKAERNLRQSVFGSPLDRRENPEVCQPSIEPLDGLSVEWECGSCASYLGSAPWPLAANLPCRCHIPSPQPLLDDLHF